jgi:hypothetical protein
MALLVLLLSAFNVDNGSGNGVGDRGGELNLPPNAMNGGWFGGGRVHPTAAVFSPVGAHLAVFPPSIASPRKNLKEERDA